ncbi:MAG TPA: DegT/DnrJ/EryC1/StrS family aminotransferase, partial [Solirubrobacterales bacterium]|nr:DegT/DnrJ/EryC1/StrS family aminotransferase [Solirubrobacterales bacterium]
MPELEASAQRRGLGILEDACEALGAVDGEERRVGARGNLASFAFYANKQMTTGEGGMLVPSSPEVAARLRSERNQGRAADMGWLDHGGLGFNYRLGDVAAALGVAQVEKLDAMLARRDAVASANCLLYEGARPVFCDVDPDTLDLDPAAVEAALGERSAGILPVHIFGYPAAMPELEASAQRRGLGILEDACEALGAIDSEGRQVGGRGNLATFAFYANKQLTTGEGGMIVPADAATAARLRSERNQGRAADMGWLDHGGLGFNYRLSDLAAALGVAQLEKLDELLARRAAVAALYEEALAGIDGLRAPIAARGAERRSWFVYAVELPEDADREAAIARLGERGIAAKAYLPCIHLFPHLRELGYREGQFPIAEAASARSLALPFFPSMSEAQVSRVCEELAAALGQPVRQG